MAASMLSVLQARLATLPGGRDLEGRPLVLVNVPSETQPWDKDQLDSVLKYFASIFSQDTRRNGLTVIVDAQRGAWRLARACIRQVSVSLGPDVATLLVVRPDAFWDKQRVDNCARSHKHGEPQYIPISRIHKYAAASQLTADLSGHWPYNPHQWIQNRIYVETFVKDAEGAVADIEKLRQRLTNAKAGLRTSTVQDTLALNRDVFEATTQLTQKVFQAGKELLHQIELGFLDGQRRGAREVSTPQDVLDSRDKIDRLLEIINVKQIQTEEAWQAMEKQFADSKEIDALEKGVTQVTNWILGAAETLLNAQFEVGFDVVSSEDLRQEHEKLELQCRETYGQYAELLHKIDSLPQQNIELPDDLRSQRDFMNFVCRSFATRLERRRNVLITSLRFFRLVSEYFEKTSEVFETLVKSNAAENAERAETTLRLLQESQISIDFLEQEVLREGERLADILSMPIKDALGRDVSVNYENDIANVQDILDATVARKNIFCDSLDLQRLTLQQVTHVYAYEQDAAQAAQWLDDLFQVMLKAHLHVGCNVYEIQAQKDEHQTFQDTAKGTYEYGGQLLTASLALRQSCKLPIDGNNSLSQKLWHSWKRLQTIGQEQMTRLRVSAVFHRSVEEHCKQLRSLIAAVRQMEDTENTDDPEQKRARLHKFLTGREKLLLEVGRMVRLGRLLRTRLREPLSQEGSGEVNDCNETAVEAISERLAEVTGLAEELDAALCGVQHDLVSPNIKKILDGTASTTPEEWYSNLKSPSKSSPEDSKSEDEFVTASECTCTPPSRSSSFHTASECGGAASPWWEPDPASDVEDTQRAKQQEVKPVVRITTEVSSDVIVHEVTETTQLRLSHNPTLDVSSYHLTTEVTRTGEPPESKITGSTPPSSESERTLSTDEELLAQLTEVRSADACPTYYYHHITRHAIKSVL